MFKNLLAVTGILASFFAASAPAAHALEVDVAQQIMPDGSAAAEACNYTYSFAVNCRVHVIGYYGNGHGMEAWNNAYLAPGTCEWAYVMPAYGFVFAYAEGDANCVAAY
jgi:hypothetical protein